MPNYLDASPMIRALSEDPSAFEIRRNCLRHRPSRHWLAFDIEGNARIFARCDCANLRVNREQSEQLQAAVAVWEETYWYPLLADAAAERRVAEINREFAKHFGPPGRVRQFLDAVRAVFGLGPRRSYLHIDPSLPEDAELLVWPMTAIREAEQDESASASSRQWEGDAHARAHGQQPA
jgi:hypothetical protein